jgi:hypothetical protein
MEICCDDDLEILQQRFNAAQRKKQLVELADPAGILCDCSPSTCALLDGALHDVSSGLCIAYG